MENIHIIILIINKVWYRHVNSKPRHTPAHLSRKQNNPEEGEVSARQLITATAQKREKYRYQNVHALNFSLHINHRNSWCSNVLTRLPLIIVKNVADEISLRQLIISTFSRRVESITRQQCQWC